jgi:DNA-binding Lrp family transcriptional regulator
MTIQQMEYVVAVDQYRHFVRAAEACGVSQSTLSTLVRKLEEELDTVIFNRDVHPVRPTQAGEKIISQARIILYNTEQLRELAVNERINASGDVKIAVLPTLAGYIVPKFFKKMKCVNPKLRLHIHELQTSEILERLSRATEEHNINSRMINEDIAAIDRAIDEALSLRRSLIRQAKEFDAMVAMIRHIRRESFLSADVAQIIATGGRSSVLQLAIIPRSVNATVDLGTTENLERKLATLRRFYDKGLSRIGWDKYSKISLRYDGQVVCR